VVRASRDKVTEASDTFVKNANKIKNFILISF